MLAELMLEGVQCFKYLGAQVEKFELLETEVKSCVKEGFKVFGSTEECDKLQVVGYGTNERVAQEGGCTNCALRN